jgi:hypothetical protein
VAFATAAGNGLGSHADDSTANAVRLRLYALAYNLDNFVRILASNRPDQGSVADEP